MPSLFPGIDPYLEAQGYWGDFHPRFVTYLCDALNEILPETYVAQLGEQVRLVDLAPRESRRIIPDVAILGGERKPGPRAARAKPAGETLTREPVAIPLPSVATEVRDVWIEILRLPKKSPVSVIEVLSPTNKTGDGFAECRLKRGKLIRRKVHLIEFDFLLAGSRLPMDRELPAGDYYAMVARASAAPIATSTPGRSGIAYRQSRSRFWRRIPTLHSTWAGSSPRLMNGGVMAA